MKTMKLNKQELERAVFRKMIGYILAKERKPTVEITEMLCRSRYRLATHSARASSKSSNVGKLIVVRELLSRIHDRPRYMTAWPNGGEIQNQQ